jgi:hypothetical protein
MNKNYKKFYEIGSNRYYTLEADDELFLATETVVPVKNILPFMKPKQMTQGLKLLKISAPVLTLMTLVADCKPLDEQVEHTPDELLKVEQVPYDTVKKQVFGMYREAVKSQKASVRAYYKDMKNKIQSGEGALERLNSIDKALEKALELIDANHPLKTYLSLKRPVGNTLVNIMIQEGFNFLYSEMVTGISQNTILYKQDTFGTLTIYKLYLVKNVVKYIDTFVYDIKLIKALLENMEKEGK